MPLNDKQTKERGTLVSRYSSCGVFYTPHISRRQSAIAYIILKRDLYSHVRCAAESYSGYLGKRTRVANFILTARSRAQHINPLNRTCEISKTSSNSHGQRGEVVRRRFVADELYLPCARPTTYRWPKPYAVGQSTRLTQHSSFRGSINK